MARKMIWTHPQNKTAYSGSTWIPLFVAADFSVPNGRIEFLGYATEELARKKLRHVLGLPNGEDVAPIGSKSYSLNAQQTRQLAIAVLQGANLIDALSSVAYQVADETEDTPAPTPEDPNNKIKFFNDASDVVLV